MSTDPIIIGTLFYILGTILALLCIELWHEDVRNRHLWHRKVGETGARRAVIVAGIAVFAIPVGICLLVWRSTPILRSETKSFVEWLRTEREEDCRF